ncbi:sodium:solute symporter family transporter [Aeoliella sp.]|uniref:sodium:solute symporter family transporter n=1 Tax=Aeoliella sp. TaxID=2795800 RepID=UPI003CCBE122
MPDAYLNQIDYAIIGLYLAVLLVLGVHLRRRASKGLQQYLIGDRSMPWWMLGVSGVMDFWDLAGSMIIVSFLYLLGPRGLFIEFRGGAVLLLAVVMLWTGKWHRRSGCLTGAEWMTFRFGEGFAGRTAQLARATMGIVMTIGLIAYLAKSVGLFMSLFLPLTPAQCALLLIGTATIYSMLSGFYGVVIIHALQLGLVLVSAVAIILLCEELVTDTQSLAMVASHVTSNPDWGATLPTINATMPPGYEAYEPLLMLAGLYLLRNVLFGMGAGDDPKYFAAKSDADCAKLTLLWISLISFRWPMMMALAVLGVSVVSNVLPDPETLSAVSAEVASHYPNQGWEQTTALLASDPSAAPVELVESLERQLGPDWGHRLQLLSEHGTVNPERIIPAVLLYAIPVGLRSLVIVSFIAAAMAGFGAWINQASGLFIKDIYLQHVRPTSQVREQMGVTWCFIVVMVAVGFGFAYSAPSINDVWSWIVMGLGSGLIFPQLLTLYWRRFNGIGYAAAMVTGMVAALLQRLFGAQLPPDLSFVNEEWFMLPMISLLSLIAAIVGSYLTSPTSGDVLQKFYNRTLPFGAWGVERRALPDKIRQRVATEHLRDVLALPVALTYQIAIFLAPMLFVIHNWTEAWICTGIAALAFAVLYFIWLRYVGDSAVQFEPTAEPPSA